MTSATTPSKVHGVVCLLPAWGHVLPVLEFARQLVACDDSLYLSVLLSEFMVSDVTERVAFDEAENAHIHIIPVKGTMKATSGSFGGMMSVLREYLAKALADLFSREQQMVTDDAFAQRPHFLLCEPLLWVTASQAKDAGIQFFFFGPTAAGRSVPSQKANQGPDVLGFKPNSWMTEEKIKAIMQIMVESKTMFPYTRGFLINTFEALEHDSLEKLKYQPHLKDVPVLCVGPLEDKPRPRPKASDEFLFDFLDGQQPNSVIYVSFGTVAPLSGEQLVQLADALVAAGKPVLWSLREVQQQAIQEHLDTATRHPFDSDHRVKFFSDSVLIVPWAPQKHVLSHPSTLCFVTHAGWGSTLETISYGVPILAFPQFGDQFTNAELLCSIGMGVAVQNHTDRLVPASELEHLLREIAVTRKEEFMGAARAWKERADSANEQKPAVFKKIIAMIKSGE